MKDLLTVEQMNAAIHDRKITSVAAVIGISYPTIKKILRGDESVTIATYRLLSDYLKSAPSGE